MSLNRGSYPAFPNTTDLGKELAFADSLEQHIVAELRRWQSLSETDRPSLESELAFLIEYYLCQVFTYSPHSGGWWCDGVEELSILPLGGQSFRILGAADWAESARSAFYLAPFELEFHLADEASTEAERIIVRFGSLDHRGQIKKSKLNSSSWLLIQRRPERNQDWAIALELT